MHTKDILAAPVDQSFTWGLLDHTNGKDAGYLRIQRNGVRIADLFPYAAVSPDPAFIREQGQRIVDAMNAVEIAADAPAK